MQKTNTLKKVFLIILLLSFSIRPIYFVGQVLYYQLNIDYIVETYCVNKEKPQLQCNGKCHLSKQLEAVSISNNSGDKGEALMVVFESFFPVFYQAQNDNSILNFLGIYSAKENLTYKNNYNFKLFSRLLRPPIAVV